MPTATPSSASRTVRAGFVACLLAGLAAASGAALAGTPVVVEADRAKVINIAGEPAAVVIGNPMFADVTLQSGRLIIHGRHYGSTNILMLDANGNQIGDLDVTVVKREDHTVSLYKAGHRYTLSCMPNCERQLAVGDVNDPENGFKIIDEQIGKKSNQATSAGRISSQ